MNALRFVGCCWLVSAAPILAAAQTPAERILSARRYVAAGQLDSARALLFSVTDSMGGAPQATRAEAFVLLGVVEHFRGVDSLARVAFRNALSVDSTLKVEGLAAVAPGAVALFEEERGKRVVFIRAMVDEPPTLLRGPRLRNPTPAITGRVLVRAIVDSAGRAVPSSIRVMQGVYPTLDSVAIEFVRRARFRPGRVAGRAVRVLVTLPVDFKLGVDPEYMPEMPPRRRGPTSDR